MSLMFDTTPMNPIPIYNILRLVPVNEYNENESFTYENKKVIISYYKENEYLISYITKKNKYTFLVCLEDKNIRNIEVDCIGTKFNKLMDLFDTNRYKFYKKMDKVMEKIQTIILLNTFHMIS